VPDLALSDRTIGIGAVLNGYRAITDHEALKDARRRLHLRI